MNKTIIININGIVFHIEEDAYEVLKTYMTDIKRHFSYSADCDEIITDIENRLAEMFNERLAEQSKQVIVLQDVQEITAKMGSVDDFEHQVEESDSTKPRVEKRLFRDPDDKAIAGVCSGLSHYFQMEAKWVRVITILVTLFTGIGFIPYIILWIVMPEANTRQEKMAMRGEAINLQNFRKTFESETDAFSQSGKYPQNRDGVESVLTSIVTFVGRVLRVIVKGIGLAIVIGGIVMLVALFGMALFGIGFLSDTEIDFVAWRAINPEYVSPICFSVFILLIIPLAALIGFAVRVIFNFRLISRTGSFAMLVLWLTGLGMGIYYGSRIAAEFKEETSFEQESVLLSTHGTYYLKFNRDRYLSSRDSAELNLSERKFEGKILDNDGSDFSELKVHLIIDKSENGKVNLIKKFESRGKNFEDALRNARRTTYRFIQQDSVLLFDKYLRLGEGTPYRDQEVKVSLQIPVGTVLIVDRNLYWNIRHFDHSECPDRDGKPFRLIMTDDGLKCSDDANTLEAPPVPEIPEIDTARH